MARLTYSDAEGVERTVRLSEIRPVRIGRESTNDIVLNDPKASRTHAEIVFEKGFFVLHDLDSANGTLINGKRIRVAPLVDAMEIAIGNKILRFSEEVQELPAQTVVGRIAPPTVGDPPPGAPPAPPGPKSLAIPRPAARNAGPAVVPIGHEPATARETLEYPQVGAASTKRQLLPQVPPVVVRPPLPPPEDATSRTPAAVASPHPSEPPAAALPSSAISPALDNRRLFIDDIDSDPDHLAVRNELDQPLVWFRSARSGVALVAKIVATMVVISGLAVTLFLLYEKAWLPSLAAILITVSFALMVGAAIPRRSIPVWTDAAHTELLLVARQEGGIAFPTLRFLVQDGSGALIGVIEKRVFPAAGRRKWRLCDADGIRELAAAREDSLARSIIGRIIGGSIRVLRTNYLITSANVSLGTLLRAKGRPGRLLLELTAQPHAFDRRLLLMLGLVIANTER